MLTSSRSLRRPRGFTLLELLVVLVILAAVAALVLPTLGFVRDQSKYATAASGAAEALSNLEIYKASTGSYPSRMDSLLNTSGSIYSKGYSGLAALTNPASGSEYYYLQNGAGITQVMPHSEDASITDPNTSTDATNPVTVAAGTVLALKSDASAISSSFAPKWQRIVKTAYPNQAWASGSSTSTTSNPDGSTSTTTNSGAVGIPTGHSLVVLGIGSRASCIGTTMTSAPIHDGGVAGRYSRYYALFDVSAGPTGRGRVQLKAVLDSEMEVISKNLANYKGSAPGDDIGGTATTTTSTTPAAPPVTP